MERLEIQAPQDHPSAAEPRCRRGLEAHRVETEISLHFFSSPLDPTRVTH
jgi:hypothetical protein